MLEVNGKVYIQLEIDNQKFELTIDSFESFTVITEADNLLPTAELALKKPTFDLLEKLTKGQSTFTISFADKQENVEEPLEFNVTNFNTNFTETNEVRYVIYGILKADSYDKDVDIKSFKDKLSCEVLEELDLGKELTLDTNSLYKESQDKQTWIQHNCTKKEFVNRILRNTYITEGDSPISAISTNKKIYIKSIRKSFEEASKNQENLVKFSNIDTGMYRYRTYKIETMRGLYQRAFIDDRKQPVIDMHIKNKAETNSILSTLLSLFKIKTDENKTTIPSGSYGDGYDYPILINTGNGHENYFKAYINNVKAKALLLSLNIILDIDQKYFKEGELKVLDIVEFRPSNAQNKPVKELTGNYMVTKKKIRFERSAVGTTLTLSRLGL